MGKVRPCQNCHGKGQIYQEVRLGIWRWVTCYACNGTGKVDTRTV